MRSHLRGCMLSALGVLVFGATELFAQGNVATPGILLLAHGGQPVWNERVTALAAAINETQPVEVAFGMATRPAIQAAIDRLVERGVSEIIAVPLFVSSHSSVVYSTEYLLGLRDDPPADLQRFAKMNHGATGQTTAHGNGSHDMHHAVPDDNTKPVVSRVPIQITPALNDHPLVASILADRARSISMNSSNEAVIFVAHGPVPDDDNARWLQDMKSLAEKAKATTAFASYDYLTVRDDAPVPVRDAAAAELRALVSKRTEEGRRVLIVPLLLSYGGIEAGIRKRLDGLSYVMADRGLIPDWRIEQWIRERVNRALCACVQ